MAILHFNDVWEIYRIKFIVEGKIVWENFWALKGVSFEIAPRESVGIIGENGAGKTTLLKIIAGLLKPDRGVVKVAGKVAGLLEMGAGFQPEMTGRENVRLNLNLMGMNQSRLTEISGRIIAFADIGRFIDAPVKCYSQGMFVRLAFSTAIHIEPEVLVIDDILAVGDEYFQRKCIQRVFELRDSGTTIICVTHDMNMLRKLCQRVILIKDGRIVKDGPTEKIIPFYTQMIGARETVAMLTQGPLSVVFNNGRVFLNWQDKPLTSSSGGYTRFLVHGRNYHSFQADWEVKKESETRFTAYGKLYSLALTLVWKMEITDDRGLTWQVEIAADGPVDIQEGDVDLLLQKEYAVWFTPSGKASFPDIDETCRDWQPLIDNNAACQCVGAMSRESDHPGLPVLVFEHEDAWGKAQVLNSDAIVDSRVLQYKLSGAVRNHVVSTDRLRWFSGRVLLNVPDLERYLDNLRSGYTVALDKADIVFNKGRCDIVCKTADAVVNSIVLFVQAGGRGYFSDVARCSIEKNGGGKMIVRMTWPDLPVTQTWEIEAVGKDTFRFNAVMTVSREVRFEQALLSWRFSKDYTALFYDAVVQDFPADFFEYEVDVLQRCIRYPEVGVVSRHENVPDVTLKVGYTADNFIKIFNSDVFSKSREIRVCKVVPEGRELLAPGQYPCFDMEVSFGKKALALPGNEAVHVRQGDVQCCFDKGRGQLFWKDRELTKGLGLYTAVCYQGRWYSSVSGAIWKAGCVDGNRLLVRGNWLRLSLSQSWEIRLLDDGRIEWEVVMTSGQDMTIDCQQANVMFSEMYDQWSGNGERASLPPFKANIDDRWDVVYSSAALGEGAGGPLTLSSLVEGGEPLPEVTLFPCGAVMNIVNSDLFHRGRMLQSLDQGPRVLRAQEEVRMTSKIIIQGKKNG